MGMGFGCYQVIRQGHYLSHALKLVVGQMLLLQQKLRHPEYPDMVKGFAGILKANQILKAKSVSGILVGGLSEAVWNRQRRVGELDFHKDVDVLVLQTAEFEKFEGGIDWWLPREERIEYRVSKYDSAVGNKMWYENGNDVVLSFGAKPRKNLAPGLFIPEPDWVKKMRFNEALAQVDLNNVEIEDEDALQEAFIRRLGKMGEQLPKFVKDQFEKQIVTEEQVGLIEFTLNVIVGINRFKGIYAEPII